MTCLDNTSELWANHRISSTSAGETTTEPWLQEVVQDVAIGGIAPATREGERERVPEPGLDISVGQQRSGSSSAGEKQLAESPDQRARRQAEQDEKILVEGGGLHPLGTDHGRRSGEEKERAAMSATSYPGQEWNPYGTGEFAWDDE